MYGDACGQISRERQGGSLEGYSPRFGENYLTLSFAQSLKNSTPLRPFRKDELVSVHWFECMLVHVLRHVLFLC